MKRPFAVVGFTYLFVLIILSLSGFNLAIAVCAVCAPAFAVSVAFKRFRRSGILPVILLTMLVACFSYGYNCLGIIHPVQAMENIQLEAEGTLRDEPVYSYGKYYYTLKIEKTNLTDAPINFNARVSSKTKLDAEPFDTLIFKMQTFSPSNALRYYAKGIYLNGYFVGEPTVLAADKKPFYFRIIQMRCFLSDTVTDMLPGQEGMFLKGMLLGDKSGLSLGVASDFRAAGVSHLLAVSGLHLSAFAMFLALCLKKLRLLRRVRAMISAAGVLFFMALTGFSASVNRAGLMILIYFAAQIFGREADGINSLGVSVFVLLLINPCSAIDTGLLLSCFATLGILTLSERINLRLQGLIQGIKIRKIKKRLSNILQGIAVSLSAYVFTLPIIVLTFGEVSLISLVTNVLVTAPATLALILTGLGAASAAVPVISFLKYPFFLCSGLLGKLILFCVNRLAELPFSYVYAKHGFVFIWLAGTLILFGLMFALRADGKAVRFSATLSCTSLLIGILSFQILNYNVTNAAVLDVGDGTCVAVTRNGRGILIGCGGDSLPANAAEDYLKSQGVRNLDFLIVPRLSDTELCGVSDFAQNCKCSSIIFPNLPETADALSENRELTPKPIAVNHASMTLWDDLTVKVDLHERLACVFLKIGETEILVSAYPGADYSMLDDEWKSPDAFIFRGMPSENTGAVSAANIIISDGERGFLSAAALNRDGGYAVSTSGNGNVIVSTRGNGAVTVKRG